MSNQLLRIECLLILFHGSMKMKNFNIYTIYQDDK